MAHGVRRLDLFVTEACNLACGYCFAAGRQTGNLTIGQAGQAISWLMESTSQRVHITFWGGEPLLRLGFLRDVVALAKEQAVEAHKTLSLSLPTNATLLDEEALAWVAENQVQTFLSIDGDQQTQAGRPLAIGGSSHDLAKRGLAAALKAPLPSPPAVRMTVTPENAARLAHNAAYFIGEGVRELLIYADLDVPWTTDTLEAFAASQLDLADLFVAQFHQEMEPSAVVRLKAWIPILRRIYRGSDHHRRREGTLNHCGVGVDLLAVTVDGHYSPCHRFVFYARKRRPRFAMGDLHNGPDLSRTGEFSRLRVEDLRGETRCAACDLFDLCTFGCPAVCFAASGELTRVPPWACSLMRAQVEACTRTFEALAGDPRLVLYLGEPLESALRDTARQLGARARCLLPA